MELYSSGVTDAAGLVKGPVFSKEIVIKETGSVSGSIESDRVGIHSHLDGKISADDVVIGSTGVVKGDIEFSNNLRTEDGADIEGYIKKILLKRKLLVIFILKIKRREKS